MVPIYYVNVLHQVLGKQNIFRRDTGVFPNPVRPFFAIFAGTVFFFFQNDLKYKIILQSNIYW